MYEVRIKHLEEAHRFLDTQIDKLILNGQFEDIKVIEMKKKKLTLKDNIAKLKQEEYEVQQLLKQGLEE
jgi:hypothetical protein